MSWLKQQIKNKLIWIAIITVLQSFLNASGIVYAVLFRSLLDSAAYGSISSVKSYSIFFLIVLLIQNLLNSVIKTVKEKTMIDIENNLKRKTLENIMYRDYAYISGIHSGEWMNKLSNDINVVAKNAVNLLPNMCSTIVYLLAALFVLIKFVPGFMLPLFVLIIIAIIFEFFFYRYIKILHKDVQEKDGMLRIYMQECINSLMVIKSYVKEGKLLEELYKYLNDYKESRIKRNRFSVIMNFFFGTGINGLLILSGVYCAYAILNNKITYGTFLAVIQIITQMRSPLAGAYSNIPNYYSMIGSIERLKEAEDYPMDQTCDSNDYNSFDFILIDHITFSYQDRNNKDHIIDDLSLKLNNGDFVAISGPSGCGKSTLFKLLLSLYKPIKGSISISCNGNERKLDNRYRKLFAYVPQDNQLMKGTIRDVVCFGEEYDENRMRKTLEISCCEEFLNSLSSGIDSELKENGAGLSEGQMQRIAIARAIYSNRPILLLDEVTSALNEELEIKILKNLREMTDKTVLLITHHKKALDYSDVVVDCSEEEGRYRWSIRKKK